MKTSESDSSGFVQEQVPEKRRISNKTTLTLPLSHPYVVSVLAAPVAQTCSLLYRRFLTCHVPPASNVLPITNRRYASARTVESERASSENQMCHFYNCSANDNDGKKGLYGKKTSDVRNPSRMTLANDFSFNCHFEFIRWGRKVFQFMYWHDKKRIGYGNVLFVDSHVSYHQATADKPDFQRGLSWSFVYNDE